MRYCYLFLIIVAITAITSAKIKWNVLESTEQQLSFEVTMDAHYGNEIEPCTFLIGLPNAELPEIHYTGFNKRSITELNKIDEPLVRWINQQKIRGLETATLQVYPVSENNQYFRNVVINMNFQHTDDLHITSNKNQKMLLENRILNWNIASDWFQPRKVQRKKQIQYPDGTWLKFSVSEDRMYAIGASDLMTLNLSFSAIDPRSIMLFTGTELGRDRSQTIINTITYDTLKNNLVEIPIWFIGEDDETLDNDDQIIFYGRGASGFNFNGSEIKYDQNIYFTTNTYWLLIPNEPSLRGQRVPTQSAPGNSTLTLDYAHSYLHVENDIINPFEGGLVWTGSGISRGGSYSVIFNVLDLQTSESCNFEIAVRGSSTDFEYAQNPSHNIDIYLNNRNAIQTSLNFNGLSNQNATFIADGNELIEGINLVFIDNNSSSAYSKPHFDHATLRYGRILNSEHSPYEFFSPIHSNTVRFSLSGNNEVHIWDITHIDSPVSMTVDLQNFTAELPDDTLSRFILFDNDDPELITDLAIASNQQFYTLRDHSSGVDHVIIGPEEYRSTAQPLVEHRESSMFVSINQIYDEFSGGNADPTAIRSFAQWTLENWINPPYCILILGDTDYDYRNITGKSNIKVPTIITGEFNNRALDDRLVAVHGNIPDLAIGRYPAKTINEVDNFIEKLIEFETHPVLGYWRSRVTLVADDAARPEDGADGGSISTGKSHTNNSENVSELISPKVEVNKLYMLEFPEVSDASSFGVIKPAATEAFMETIAEGTAIINYIGHGSEHQWAQEKLLVQDRGDIDQMDTEMKLPIWIAGTCSWGHFDFLDEESFAEELIREPMDGASAIITTSRAIGVSSNALYIEKIFRAIFPELEITNSPVGVILQSVKDGNSSGELFHLFGDPAMPLTIPNQTVQFTDIYPDTIFSLDTARVFGEQTIDNQASGTGILRLVDAKKEITRTYNISSTQQEISYSLPGPILFKGQFSIAGSQFVARVRIPKDISYSNLPAACNAYVKLNSNPSVEALGYLDNIYTKGGLSVNDNLGPIISFETENGQLLRNHDHLNKNQKLFLRLSDPIGINITGEVGHEILVTDLADNTHRDISNRFIYDENSISSGIVEIPFANNQNSISLKIKAWDNANNPAEVEVSFDIITKEKLQIFNVLNFPNPYTSTTQFAFELTLAAEVSIDIYTLGGRKVAKIPGQSFSSGYHYIDWNGRDAYGNTLANGVYLYNLTADDGEQSVSVIRKIAKFK